MIINFLRPEDKGNVENLKYKEYEKCDPAINYKRNWYYASNLYQPTDLLVYREFGYDNRELNNRKVHETELLEKKNAYSVNSIFGKYCHNEFKSLADSVQKARFDLISRLKINP